ncbi:beta-N-acetylglucosaminidase domain-containing protein [Micromonospora sp. NPDC047074]|uniref:beta-N-acetylglucosaminidase domain-containing protein n=1 Tax=Micromonospora sp. NPDC047074 TaxID=3154339 RepID=UPI0033D51094
MTVTNNAPSRPWPVRIARDAAHGAAIEPWHGVSVIDEPEGAGWSGLTTAGPDPLLLRARLDPAAGGPTEGYALRLWADSDGRRRLEAVAATQAGLRHARRTAEAIIQSRYAVTTTITDHPEIARRGLLECFYGPAWSERDRHTMITEAAAWGMNSYCYGPSGDPHVGVGWRQPYDVAKRAEFERLAALGARTGVEICFRISPSAPLEPAAGMVFSDPDETALLLARLDDLLDTGLTTILLAFDDVENGLVHEADRRAFAADPHPVAAAHARVARAVGEHLAARGANLVICPIRYWGTEPDAYNTRLTELIGDAPAAVEYCWTGPRVTSARITVADAAGGAARHGGRPLFLWDNYPVNDWDSVDPATGAPARRRLFLAPMQGRAGGIGRHLGSYLVNGTGEPLPGIPALATAAQWAWNPTAYEAGAAWQDVLERYDEHGGLAQLAAMASSSPLHLTPPHPLAVAVFEYLAGARDAATVRSRLADARRHLRGMPEALALTQWVSDVTFQLDAAESAVNLIEAFRHDDDHALADAAQWLADRRHRLDAPFPPALLDGALIPLVERGRGLAGGPIPPHDV